MRKRITYANVAATLALVFSMTGGALAASHYLINSTKQISPKVLKKLRGATGKTGAAGPQGIPGATGKEGAPGTSAPKLLAAIKENGEVTRAQGLVSATKVGTGEYALVWNQPISNCYPIGSLFAFTGYFVIEGIKKTNPAELEVDTYDASSKLADTGFYVAVLC